MRVALAAALAVVLIGSLAGGASAVSTAPTARLQLGVLGDVGRFQRLTGQRSTVAHSFIGWHQPRTIRKLLHLLRSVPMLAIKTGGVVTPLDIAQGRGDGFLVELNAALAGDGARVYVRPRPEMNGHWNEYSAFNRDGSSRGPRYSTAAFRKCVRPHRPPRPRRDGRAAQSPLAEAGTARRPGRPPPHPGAHGLEPTGLRRAERPRKLGGRVLPGRYLRGRGRERPLPPGVGGRLGGEREALRRAPPRKPFAIAEWGLWGIDDPSFVERMAAFVRTHPRLELLAYFNSKPGSVWDLQSKPRSLRTYRRVITPLGR